MSASLTVPIRHRPSHLLESFPVAWNDSVSSNRKAERARRRAAGLCIDCGARADGFYACEKCRKKRAAYEHANKAMFKRLRKSSTDKIKRQAILHYGDRCSCCEEAEMDFLTLDHVNDDGAEHRRETGKQGSNFYRWLVKNNFPDDYELRVLCFNCNNGRRVAGGVCPHKRGAPCRSSTTRR